MNKGVSKNLLLMILGIVIILLTIIIEDNTAKNSFRAGIFTGVGVGIIIISITYIVKSILYKKYPEKMKKADMLSTEERKVMIKAKAGSMAYSASCITSAIIIIMLAASNAAIEMILIVCCGIVLNLIVFVFMLFYYDKKY